MSDKLLFADLGSYRRDSLQVLRVELDSKIKEASRILDEIKALDFLDNTDFWEDSIDNKNDFFVAVIGCRHEKRQWEKEAMRCEEECDTAGEDNASKNAHIIHKLEYAFAECAKAYSILHKAETEEVGRLIAGRKSQP